MTREDLITAIDEELVRLQQMLQLLKLSSTEYFGGGIANLPSKEKRAFTPEGRMRISQAQKKRWAEYRTTLATSIKSV